MQSRDEMLSIEEQKALASHLACSKQLVERIAGCLQARMPEEQLLVMRAQEAQAALQRLEWQIERTLGPTP